MNKCSILALFVLVNVFNVTGNDWTNKAQSKFKYHSKQKSSDVFALSYLVGYFIDKGAAARYSKYGRFYPIKKESKADLDTAIDLALFPLVDYGVGRLMRPLRNMAYMHGVKNGISPHGIDFIADEVQLVTSAAIVRGAALLSERKLAAISKPDLKDFVKSSLMQVFCDTADETIIAPIVKMTVGSDETWSGSFVHGVAKLGLIHLVKEIFTPDSV